MLKIRAHHLLCMQGFQGYGYSAEFVINLGALITQLKNNPQTEIQIIASNDTICSFCPHNADEKCKLSFDSQQKIQQLDTNILKTLCISEGIVLKFDTALKLIQKHFADQETKRKVCGECGWRDKCLWIAGNNGITTKMQK
jgi:uncharacterized protein